MSESSLQLLQATVLGNLTVQPDSNPMPVDQGLNNSVHLTESVSKSPPATNAADKENLASYAGMAHGDRMSVLENMIIDSISDENFATLCEDVYGCWQRIGFGL